jgi:hypothetical protein
MTPTQLAEATELAKKKVARHAEGRRYYRTFDEIAAEIARDKATAEARIAEWKASLRTNKGDQS